MDNQKPGDYIVERLRPSDVRSMAALHSKVFIDTFTKPPYELEKRYSEDRMANKYSDEEIEKIQRLTIEDSNIVERIWFVAKAKDGHLIGMARPYRTDEEGYQRVGAIYVDREHQGSGVAGALMQKVLEWSKPNEPLYLWVAKDNLRAISFYEKWGFRVVEGKHQIVYGKVPHIQMIRKGEKQ